MIDDYGPTEGTGIAGISSVLLILFIVLKLFGVITWPWIWVFSPMWIPAALLILAITWIGIRGE